MECSCWFTSLKEFVLGLATQDRMALRAGVVTVPLSHRSWQRNFSSHLSELSIRIWSRFHFFHSVAPKGPSRLEQSLFVLLSLYFCPLLACFLSIYLSLSVPTIVDKPQLSSHFYAHIRRTTRPSSVVQDDLYPNVKGWMKAILPLQQDQIKRKCFHFLLYCM